MRLMRLMHLMRLMTPHDRNAYTTHHELVMGTDGHLLKYDGETIFL